MNSKSLIQSKTFWVAVLQIGFGVIGMMMSWLDNEAAVALMMSGMAHIGLRNATEAPVSGFLPK